MRQDTGGRRRHPAKGTRRSAYPAGQYDYAVIRDIRDAAVAIVGMLVVIVILVAIGWANRPINVDHTLPAVPTATAT